MSDILESAARTIKEIRERAETQKQRNREKLAEALRADGRRRKLPGDFGDSSYLMIRSHAADIGQRPLASDIVFWLSPDIRVRPLSGPGAYTQTLEAGRSYDVEVLLRNRGDIPVPSAKVELYLTDPTLGFDTRFATRLGIGSSWVPGVGSGKVNLPFTVSGAHAGHKCLIARTFSMSPLDIPLDDTNLSPPLDRHVAQLNLTIIGASQSLQFNIVHQPNFEGTLRFRTATMQELAATGHPLLAERRLSEEDRFAARLARGAAFERVSEGRHELALEGNGETVRFTSRGDGPALDEQKSVGGRVAHALEAIAAGRARPSEFKDIFTAHRKLRQAVVVDSFSMRLPDVGIEGEGAAAVHVQLDSTLGGTVGGFTLLFTR